MKICKLCENTIPTKLKIDGKVRNLNNRKYCLDCSPFGEHNTRQLENIEADTAICCQCHQQLPVTNFYKTPQGRLKAYCKKCWALRKRGYVQRFKLQCVRYKGNRCCICSYQKCIGALEFHHLNPNEKDFGISKRGGRGAFTDKVKAELDKCILVCANCHREIHEGMHSQYAVVDYYHTQLPGKTRTEGFEPPSLQLRTLTCYPVTPRSQNGEDRI
mgnify:FL=1